MGRLEETFARLRGKGRTGLVTYVTAGDPDRGRSIAILRTLEAAGADVLEVGVPFSDPLADGPVIQRASERALAGGTTLATTLRLVDEVRPALTAPIVLFSYANPILRLGLEEFADRAAAAGVDGVLVLDLPIEEAGPARDALARVGIDMIFLLSPTTTHERLTIAASLGSGFLYGISRLGVTGVRDRLEEGVAPMAERIRAVTSLPLALGFGLSRPEHIVAVGRFADAAVVGSGLVALIAEARTAPDLEERIAAYLRWLRGEGPGIPEEARTDCRPAGREIIGAMTIDELRRRIDALDAELVRLLNDRAACALQIGQLKRAAGMEIYQPEREREVLQQARAASRGPLSPEAITRLFERIIDEARRLERLAACEEQEAGHSGAARTQDG